VASKFTEVKISGLKDGLHSFQFDLNDKFLSAFSHEMFKLPELQVKVEMVLSETVIKTQVLVEGSVELECDRSLDSFRHPVSTEAKHYFKFGEEEKELSDELEVILKERVSIDFDQLVFDIVSLSLPSKKLHPRFMEDAENEDIEGSVVFSTESKPDDNTGNQEIDSRWAKLKELNV